MIDVSTLIAAWEKWDARPRERATAVEMNDQCNQIAALIDMDPNQFRETLSAGRRAGMSREAILAELVS